MNSTIAAHGSRTKNSFFTTVELSIKAHAVLPSNASKHCSCSKSCVTILSLITTQNKHH